MAVMASALATIRASSCSDLIAALGRGALLSRRRGRGRASLSFPEHPESSCLAEGAGWTTKLKCWARADRELACREWSRLLSDGVIPTGACSVGACRDDDGCPSQRESPHHSQKS